MSSSTIFGTGPMRLPKYSLGVGDRFAREAAAQLEACRLALDEGVEVTPVWNKSNREHQTIGSQPSGARKAADVAVRDAKWDMPYFVDADHINLSNVDAFLAPCDFFTIDVASAIGKAVVEDEIERFVDRHAELRRAQRSIEAAMPSDGAFLRSAAAKYLAAIKEAGRIYRHIANTKGAGNFITEVSMDETEAAQTPAELMVILAGLAGEGIPLQTIAPKFSGRFNKGVDYVGDPEQFEKEFRADVAVIAFAIREYGLPYTLKLSVHSGSDKFAIYPSIHEALYETNAGVHVKTAGTTWLEELIGLAEAGGDALQLAKDIYQQALLHREELCAPYATVIDIDDSKLPAAKTVRAWDSARYVRALRHDQSCAEYNPSFRQLLHVGYKVATKMGDSFLKQLEECRETISCNVTRNLYERHIGPIFLGKK